MIVEKRNQMSVSISMRKTSLPVSIAQPPQKNKKLLSAIQRCFEIIHPKKIQNIFGQPSYNSTNSSSLCLLKPIARQAPSTSPASAPLPPASIPGSAVRGAQQTARQATWLWRSKASCSLLYWFKNHQKTSKTIKKHQKQTLQL